MRISIMDLGDNTSYGLNGSITDKELMKDGITKVPDIFRVLNATYKEKLESSGLDMDFEKMVDMMFYNFSRLGYTDLLMAGMPEDMKKSQRQSESYIRDISEGLASGRGFSEVSDISDRDVMDWASFLLTKDESFIADNRDLSARVNSIDKVQIPKVASDIVAMYAELPKGSIAKNVMDASYLADRGADISKLEKDISFRGINFIFDLIDTRDASFDDASQVLSRHARNGISNYYELSFALNKDGKDSRRVLNAINLNGVERIKAYAAMRDGIPKKVFSAIHDRFGEKIFDQVEDVRKGRHVYSLNGSRKGFKEKDVAFVYSIMNFGNIHPLRDNDVLNYNSMNEQLQDDIKSRLRSMAQFNGGFTDEFKHADVVKDGYDFKGVKTKKLVIPSLYKEVGDIAEQRIRDSGSMGNGFASEVVDNVRKYFSTQVNGGSYIKIPKGRVNEFKDIANAAGYGVKEYSFCSNRSGYLRLHEKQ